MVRNVEFSPKYQVDSSFLETLYGESIWTLDETSVESLYSADPTIEKIELIKICLLYTSPSPRDSNLSRMPSSA